MPGDRRAGAAEHAAHVNAAAELLESGVPAGEAARVLAGRLGCSQRQARRYVSQAAASGRVPVPEPGAVFTVRLPARLATPDLMPADILGTTILRSDAFIFHPGPVFTDLLLVDEINRMPPRTQAELLGMHGRAAGDDRRPAPAFARMVFTVFATQNPVDFEGTYPLPEAQLDRFLMKVRIAYPSEQEELQILERHHAGSGAGLLEDAAIAPLPPQNCWQPHAPKCARFGSSRSFTGTFLPSPGAPANGRPCRLVRAPVPR